MWSGGVLEWCSGGVSGSVELVLLVTVFSLGFSFSQEAQQLEC